MEARLGIRAADRLHGSGKDLLDSEAVLQAA